MAQTISSIEVSPSKSPNSFNYKIVSDGGEPCGAVVCFGDGKCDSVEIKEAGMTMLTNTYKQVGDYPVYIYGEQYASFFKELDACKSWPKRVYWIARDVSSYKNELDILLLANPKFVSKNIDGTLRFAPKKTDSSHNFDCGNIAMISDFNESLIRRFDESQQIKDDFYNNQRYPLLFNASFYKQISIDQIDKIGLAEIDKFLATHGVTKPREQRQCLDEFVSSPSLLANASVVAIPRTFISSVADVRPEWKMIESWPVVTTLTMNVLMQTSQSLNNSENEAKANAEKLQNQYMQSQKANSKSTVGSLIFGLKNNQKLRYSDTFACSVKSGIEDSAALNGYRIVGNNNLTPEHKQALLKYGLSLEDAKSDYPNFHKIYEDLNTVFVSISERKSRCFIYVDYAENIYSLYEAIQREQKVKDVTFGLIKDSESMRDQTAQTLNFENWAQKKFADSVGANSNQIKALKSNGVFNSDDYKLVSLEMAKSGYSKSNVPNEILSYLEDRFQGKAKNISAMDQKNLRLKDAQLANDRYVAEQYKARLERSKEFPYEAILICGLNGMKFDLAACMAGKIGGEVELRNGSKYGLYKIWDLNKLGRNERDVGLVIPLRKNFSIRANNFSDDLILTLRVINTVTQEEVYIKSVSKYGTIRLVK